MRAPTTLDVILDHERLVTATVRATSAHPHWRFRGVPFSAFARDADAFARAVAADVRAGRFVAGHPKTLRLRGGRTVAITPLPDMILASAAAAVLTQRAPPAQTVWSYQPGLSPIDLLHAAAADLRRRIRRQRLRPITERALFVFRSDVKGCSDSVRVDDDAPLWLQLQTALNVTAQDPAFALVKALVRPVQKTTPLQRGIWQGSPLNNVLVNLHLQPLDAALAAHGDRCFVGRFGDDTIVIADDANAIRAAVADYRNAVAALSLSENIDKASVTALNRAGRPIDGIPGAPAVELVGLRLQADATLALKPKAARAVVRAVARRASVAVSVIDAAAGTASSNEDGRQALRLRAAVGAASTALRPRVDAPPALRLLHDAVTCRRQLNDLDRAIAGVVAAAISGTAPPRAFRAVSWARLREAGLPSLVAQRNGHAP